MRNKSVSGVIKYLALIGVLIEASNGSTINRNLMDNIQTGINLAGKMFGFDTAATEVADLVARAFAPIAKRQSMHENDIDDVGDDRDRPNMHDSEALDSESIAEEQPSSSDANTGNNDNGFVKGDGGFMGNVLRIIGLDNGKLGALAVNGLIFIAQIIGRSLMSTFGFKSPAQGYARNADDATSETPLDWILDQQSTNSLLSQQLLDVRNRNLPQQVVQSISGSDAGEDGSADCIKLLVCKSAPIIWGMQRAVFERIDGTADEKTVSDDDRETVEMNNNKQNKINDYFKYLPAVAEFKKHGDACEDRYTRCKIFS